MGLKDNINPHDLPVEPAEIIDDPPPKPEEVVTVEDAGEANARVLRYQPAIRRGNELNVERRRKALESAKTGFITRLLRLV